MRTVYEITHWDYDTQMQARSYRKLYRAPAAKSALYAALYDMVRSQALLDRPIAHIVMEQYAAFEEAIRPPVQGWYTTKTFRLRPNDGPSVTFRAYREY